MATQNRTTKTPARKPRGRKGQNGEGIDLNAVNPQFRDQVESMIPPIDIANNYINRTVAGMRDFEMFDLARKTKHNVLMPGPTGSGKTTAGRAYAAWRKVPFVSIEMQGGFDFATTVGSTRADENGLPVFKFGELAIAVQYPSVIFIDEVNFAPPRFTAAFHGTLDARQSLYVHEIGERLRKHPDCVIFSAYNDGYQGTVRLNEAFTNRFAFVLPWDYSPEVEETLIGAYSPRLLNMVRQLRRETLIHTPIGTNVMEEFLNIAALADVDVAGHLFVNRFPDAERVVVAKVWEAQRNGVATELADLAEPDLAAADE